MDSNIFYILAPGKSINNITEEEWKFLEDKNTISFSNFVFTNKKSKYHFSYENPITDRIHLEQMKKNGFLDTHLLLGIRQSIRYAKELGFRNITKIIKGPSMPFKGPWKLSEPSPILKFKECRNYSFNEPMFRYRGSLSSVIVTSLILGANEIRLVGVDLNSQYYFFHNNLERWCRDKDDEERINFIINNQERLIKKRLNDNTMVSNFNPLISNDTNEVYNWNGIKIRGMGDLILWIDKELREEGFNGIYITNKNSKLFNELDYKEIMDE